MGTLSENLKMWPCYGKFDVTTYIKGASDYEIMCLVIQKCNEVLQMAPLSVITYANPIQWNITTQYSQNTIVVDPSDGTAYLSTQPVPSGVQISNTDYWTPVFTLQNFIDPLKEAICKSIPQQENGQAATQLIPANSLFFVGNVLCTNTSEIPNTSLVIIGSNCEQISVEELLSRLSEQIAQETEDREKADTQLQQNITAEQTAREEADTQLQQNITAEQSEREQADTQLSNQIAAEQQARQQADNNLQNAIKALGLQTFSGAEIITPQMYGAKGDGVTDDTQAFRDAIEAAISENKTLYIPIAGTLDSNGYILSGTLNIDYPCTIICDPSTVMNWANAHSQPSDSPYTGRNGAELHTAGIGININYGTYAGHKGYYRFGILQGDKSYSVAGASLPWGNYWTGVKIASADLVDFYATYISYWLTGMEIAPTTTGGVENCEIGFHVMDDCPTGIRFNLASATNGIYVCTFKFNTIGITQYGIAFEGNGGSVFSGNRIMANQIYVEHNNGCCIVGFANYIGNILESEFDVQSCVNSNTNNTISKFNDNSTFHGDIITGSYNSNSYYGFPANNCTFNLGYWYPTNGNGNSVSVFGQSSIVKNKWYKFSGYSSPVTTGSDNPSPYNVTVIEYDPGKTVEAGGTDSFTVYLRGIAGASECVPIVQMITANGDIEATPSLTGYPHEVTINIYAKNQINSGYKYRMALIL